MEIAVAKALKPSLRREFIFQQVRCEELLCLNGNNAVGGEDFSVDDLLDFSNGEFQHEHASLHYEQEEEEEEEEEEEYEEEKDSISSVSSQSQSQDRGEDDSNSNSTSGNYHSIFSAELAVPGDDLADLEWVSHFVDDSLPEFSLLYPVRSEQTRTWTEPEPGVFLAKKTTRFASEMKIPTKARTTKGRKPNARVWSFSPLLSPVKKLKKKAKAEAQPSGGAQLLRRCSHCEVQKTPQWRTGPLGPKTLCNACGVRYKSGRLFSEYRPACSPTFSSDIHSNSHRKVLEMRRRKGVAGPEAGLVHTQMVPSC